ncbi:aldo/keto reductase [Streptomyces sp. NPDC059455]|uniref:aldo/keto reductase n=1 Tax=Streptomyces sp. NPDC059455 TaxID=3346837 RepID=UPI0036961016
MKTRELGRTGIRVSPYCLGTMLFGRAGNPDHDDCVRIIHRALDSGINFIDTADVYGPHGESEDIVGRALKGWRDDIVLATKVNGTMGDDPNRAGSVRAIGSSNLPASEIVEARWVADRRGLHRFRTEQPPYSILNRAIEREVLPVCRRYGMGMLVWSPLAMGLLTERYREGGPTVRNARMKWVPRHLTDERELDAVERLIPLAEDAGLSLTHLAMAFAITHPGVTSAIIGPRTMEHLEDLLAGATVTLDDDVLDRIARIVAPGTDIGPLDVSYTPPSVQRPALRRRPADERAGVAR